MSIIYITSSNLAAYIRTLTWDVAMGLDTDRLMGLSLRIFCFDTVFSSVLMHSCFVFFLVLSCALCSYATAVFLCCCYLSLRLGFDGIFGDSDCLLFSHLNLAIRFTEVLPLLRG